MPKLVLVRELREAEKEELERLSWDREVGYRAKIVLLSNEGYRVNEISVQVDIFPDKVRKWIKCYEGLGIEGLQKKKRSCGGWKFSEDTRKRLKELAESEPRSLGYKFSTWTLEALCGAAVEREIVKSITREWLRQILRSQGVKWRQSGLILKSRDPNYALKKTTGAAVVRSAG